MISPRDTSGDTHHDHSISFLKEEQKRTHGDQEEQNANPQNKSASSSLGGEMIKNSADARKDTKEEGKKASLDSGSSQQI